MNKFKQTLKYVISDYLAAIISWIAFFLFRKVYIDPQYADWIDGVYFDVNFIGGLVVIPIFWMLLHLLSGYYKNIYRKSRLRELHQTFRVVLIGVLILFFAILLDDFIVSYKQYYKSVLAMFSLQFLLTYIPRMIFTTKTNRKIQNREIGFNTLMIGSNDRAVNLYKRLMAKPKSTGYKFVGFVNIHQKPNFVLAEYMPHLGSLDNLKQIIDEYKIEEIIIAVEPQEHKELEFIVNKIEGAKVVIKAIPDSCDILIGKAQISALYDEPMICISQNLMPIWQIHFKRIFDVVVSILVMVIGSPIYLALAIGVKMSSPGPVIYSHERIGRYGKPFQIYKFRSMRQDAESNGPALTQENDSRITKLGNFMRKTRLDEIPQFYNVLKGDMSIVGPRPERQFFIDQIVKKAPHYSHLHRVRPGITSWGQVKYGYASNVDEMVERLKYDIVYIENMSIYIDIKIMIYTIGTVVLAKGL